MSHRATLPVLVLALAFATTIVALAGAAPAQAAAPREGRWVGTSGSGSHVSFTVQAFLGRRYVANVGGICGNSGTVFAGGLIGVAALAWPLDHRGRVGTPEQLERGAPIRGRLDASSGTVRVFGSEICSRGTDRARRERVSVHWVPAHIVASGNWTFEDQGPALGGSLVVTSGATASIFKGFEGSCEGASEPANAWIRPDGAFAAPLVRGPGGIRGRFAGASASGTYSLCGQGPFRFTARLVKPAPPPRAGNVLLPPLPGSQLPLPPEPVDYVALGDSYSAGESVRPFDPGTATLRNTCHRSRDAYSRRLKLPGYRFHRLFFACSRAVTDHVGRLDAATGQIQGKVQHPSESTVQVQRLSLADWSAVDMVTLTIGGNDAKFARVLIQCRFRSCHRGSRAREIKGRIAHVGSKLASTYAAIARAARNATVFVLGYPQLFPERPRSNCPRGKRTLPRPRQVFLRERGGQLNRVIRRRAAAAGFHFVDAEPSFRDHEPCGPKNEWINAFVIRPDPHFSFHPNRAGQAAYARTLAGYIRCLAANAWPFTPSGMPENPRGRRVPTACG